MLSNELLNGTQQVTSWKKLLGVGVRIDNSILKLIPTIENKYLKLIANREKIEQFRTSLTLSFSMLRDDNSLII